MTRRPGPGAHRGRPLLAPVLAWVALLLVAPARTLAVPVPLPTPRGLVSDFARVIDPPIAARLEARLGELQRKTGAEIAVVTVETTAPDDVFDYAIRLAEAWKPGAAGQDNGVLFVTAVRDRALHILTGYGLEGALPDGRVGEIRDRAILPRFRAGDYGGGILAGTEQLAAIVAAEYGITLSGAPPRLARRPQGRTGGFPLLLVMLVFFVLLPNLRLVGPHGRRRRGLWTAGPMWGTGFGGGGFGGGGGGFGGFGGGGFGGGGAGGRW